MNHLMNTPEEGLKETLRERIEKNPFINKEEAQALYALCISLTPEQAKIYSSLCIRRMKAFPEGHWEHDAALNQWVALTHYLEYWHELLWARADAGIISHKEAARFSVV